jgi:tRNA (cmo5U34)-methyltransferase
MHIITSLVSQLDSPCDILELCCGEGLLAEMLLDRFPDITVYGLDGSIEMLNRAKKRLARFNNRFRGQMFDLATDNWRELEIPISAVVSSLAIHHLTGPQKRKLFLDVYRMLMVDGIIVIADVIEHQNEAGRYVAAEAWDEIVQRQSLKYDGNIEAFELFQREGWNMYRYFDPEDIDKPSQLFDQLKWLENSGFDNIDVHWMLAGHAVFSARKSKRN